MRWQYFKSSSLSPSTEFAISQNQVIRSLHIDNCRGFTLYVVPVSFGVLAKFRIPRLDDITYNGLYIFTLDDIALCMMLLAGDLVVCSAGGGSTSLSWEL
jgi:dTDP-4-dehydrorhamnose 3,5-epimerase-like enzyme